MDSITIDRRRVKPLRDSDWKRLITPDQAETLRSLEQVGWSLRFVRRADSGSVAAVYNPDRKSLAIIEADGRLIEDPAVPFRA